MFSYNITQQRTTKYIENHNCYGTIAPESERTDLNFSIYFTHIAFNLCRHRCRLPCDLSHRHACALNMPPTCLRIRNAQQQADLDKKRQEWGKRCAPAEYPTAHPILDNMIPSPSSRTVFMIAGTKNHQQQQFIISRKALQHKDHQVCRSCIPQAECFSTTANHLRKP